MLQVVVLVLDAIECSNQERFMVTQQDFRLAELIAAEGRACVIVVNKVRPCLSGLQGVDAQRSTSFARLSHAFVDVQWDAVPTKDTHTLATYQKELLAQLRPLDWASVVFTSALSGQRVHKILEAAAAAGEEHNRRISTATLNMVRACLQAIQSSGRLACVFKYSIR